MRKKLHQIVFTDSKIFSLQSPIQRPSNFIPQGVGSPPNDSMSLREECEGQRGELKVRCGQIVCNIDELEPGTPPSEITVFAYLFVSVS